MKHYIILLLLLTPLVFAETSMKLLAVSKEGDNYSGTTAELFLEINKGRGRVFLDTYPLTKLDTQFSTRYARDVACDYLDRDCSTYDFIYTLRADSTIIGGPSAGAAITLLTIVTLDNQDYDDNIAITGTINSGGLIGPVGGVKEKIEAASSIGIKKVMIPKGEAILNEDNITTNLTDYASSLDVELIEVFDIGNALSILTGKEIKLNKELKLDDSYINTMQMLSEQLCNRSRSLKQQVLEFNITNTTLIGEDFLNLEEEADNYSLKAEESFLLNNYYSAASFCFTSNVRWRRLLLELQNLSMAQTTKQFFLIDKGIKEFNNILEKVDIKTITDLQAYTIIKERLVEAQEGLNISATKFNNNESHIMDLAYTIERLYSANSWSNFLNSPGKEFVINEQILEKSCNQKIMEAEELLNYVQFLLPTDITSSKTELNYAYKDKAEKNYELCLFKASKAKAEANVLLSLLFIGPDQYKSFIDNKLEVIRNSLAVQTEKGIFPIVGYSYYEFANSLKDTEDYSALLFSEYALELGKLELYFKEKNSSNDISIDYRALSIFVMGIVLGASVYALFMTYKKHRFKRRIKKKR